jgi:hypothetical protein
MQGSQAKGEVTPKKKKKNNLILVLSPSLLLTFYGPSSACTSSVWKSAEFWNEEERTSIVCCSIKSECFSTRTSRKVVVHSCLLICPVHKD